MLPVLCSLTVLEILSTFPAYSMVLRKGKGFISLGYLLNQLCLVALISKILFSYVDFLHSPEK